MAEKHTPTPWGWVVHDHSCASLGVLPDPGIGDPLVLSISPCRSCADKAEPKEWVWGRCCTPSEDDAHFIVRAVNSYDKLVEALKEARTFIEAEYRDPSAEPDGEWLAKDARPVHALVCAALASLDQESGQ